MQLKQTLVKGGLAASVAADGVAGAVIFAPSLSSAQDQATDDQTTDSQVTDSQATDSQATDEGSSGASETPSEETAGDDERPGPGRGGRHGPHLETVAEVIGIEVDELREALSDGETIADIAEANGADVDAVVDALVAEATERIEAKLAELPERMEDLVNGELGPLAGGEHGGRHGFGRHDGPRNDQPDADAEAGSESGESD
jgi:hypothetical protein